MTLRRPVRCSGTELSEYAAGRLGDDRTRDWDRHLVACECCRREVAEERRLRAALAGGPTMPGDLRVTLLAMARDLEDVPLAPAPRGPEPLPLLAPGAPACHRSPLRATVVAAAAAGVSAAAAWSLTVVGVPAPRTGVVSGPSLPVVSPAAGRPGTSASLVSVRWTTGTSATQRSTRQAESSP
ncbi:anti-sigma factor family protein [Phycicoccus flavus]|uniref:Zinc-finger domain-containing protein n=1 Tax=Phycicoccus flavus TaxID=2502783 RepID=A0A8T6R8W4_9MICO|nr:hypothetical protein [Phycicoccus flavus]NHA69840.1 hypothetical protein [Phycicoccus flavus]